jgi:hypothetical protein
VKVISPILFAASVFFCLSASALTTSDYYGSGSAASFSQRQITLNPDTHYVNVQKGEVVTITDGDTMITWQFDGIKSSFPLAQVFPASAHAQNITVYIAAEPML